MTISIKFKVSKLSSTAAQAASSMLLLAVMGLIIPAAMFVSDGGIASSSTRTLSAEEVVLSCSRFTDQDDGSGDDPIRGEDPILSLWGSQSSLNYLRIPRRLDRPGAATAAGPGAHCRQPLVGGSQAALPRILCRPSPARPPRNWRHR
jgi:hypothetical protein